MSCGAPEGGVVLEEHEAAGQAVVTGEVRSGGDPVHPAYVRLLDESGEFVAEVPTGPGGEFRFYPAPGEWTLRVLAPGNRRSDGQVTAVRGRIARITLQM